MDLTWLKARIGAHVTALAGEIGPRPCGSPANLLATDYVRMVLAATGLAIDERPFSCTAWEPGTATLQVGGAWIDVPPAPFSRPCSVRGRVARISTDDELQAATLEPGRIIVIHGELTAESYLPKAFPFLEPTEQRQRLARLEALEPAAVIAAVAGWRIESVLEDGDLTFPYVVVPVGVGERMREGREVAVRIGGALRDAAGSNIATRSGPAGPRIILSAHLDTKVTTPGAFDNAGGVATLLALAESGLPPNVPIELVFFNGEDHFQAPGEQAWLAATDLSDIRHVVNIDGAGVVGHPIGVTTLACPAAFESAVRDAVACHQGWEWVPAWYESDHAIFAMRGIPSVAITSAGAHGLANVIHSERDTTKMVDPALLASVAGFLEESLLTA
jgi:aminopeptidase YwaD